MEPADPLDNIIWHALTTRQASFALGNGRARRYPVAIAPFAGLAHLGAGAFADLAAMVAPGESVALFTPNPIDAPAAFVITRRDRIDQMICDALTPVTTTLPIVALGPADADLMIALTALTEPGPFGPRTAELGDFFGIRIDEQLAAMAGERMKLTGFTEVSGVCTHPDHRGRKLAAMLAGTVCTRIREHGETPILHVYSHNAPAIAVYRGLGFVHNRTFHLAILERR